MTDRHTRLAAAIIDDRSAIAQALRAGQLATRPHSAARLAQLCELGERMMQTALRRQDAQRDLSDATIGCSPSVDYILPA